MAHAKFSLLKDPDHGISIHHSATDTHVGGALQSTRATWRKTVQCHSLTSHHQAHQGLEDPMAQLSVKAVPGAVLVEVQDEEELIIIVDPGADASPFPGSLLGRREKTRRTAVARDVGVTLQPANGASQLVLSLGHLLKAGWPTVCERLHSYPLKTMCSSNAEGGTE